MKHGIVEIDHLMTAVHDPQSAGATFESLGFTATPLSLITAMGLGNRLVLFTPLTAGTANFIELFGITDPARVQPVMGELLRGEEGLRSMVLSGPDAAQSHRELVASGYPFAPPIDVEREWRLPSGEVVKPAFRVLLPVPAPFSFNFCEYKTLSYYLRPEWLTHANGARSVIAVWCIAEDLADAADYYEALYGSRAERSNGWYSVGPGAVRMRIGTRDAIEHALPGTALLGGATRYVGYTIRVARIEETRRYFDAHKIEYIAAPRSLLIPPRLAHGNVIEFVE